MANISPVCAIWIAWFITAANVVISKLATPYVSSALFLLLVCTVASACFAVYFWKDKQWKNLFRKDVWPKALAMGTFGTALPMTIFMIALNYTTPVNVAIDNQFEIIYSLILTAVLLKERPTPKQLGGSALILLGVGLILLQPGTSLAAKKGDLMVLGCLWMYQVSHIFAKKLPSDLSPALIAAARAFYAIPALVVLVACLPVFNQPIQLHSCATLWIILFASAIFNYFIGNTFWYRAIRNMDLSKATAIILSYPVMTYILSVCFGQDTVTLIKITGMVLAIGGAYIVTGIIKKGDAK